jgi:hypothetical protein
LFPQGTSSTVCLSFHLRRYVERSTVPGSLKWVSDDKLPKIFRLLCTTRGEASQVSTTSVDSAGAAATRFSITSSFSARGNRTLSKRSAASSGKLAKDLHTSAEIVSSRARSGVYAPDLHASGDTSSATTRQEYAHGKWLVCLIQISPRCHV